MSNLAKIFKCGQSEDCVTLRAEDPSPDKLKLTFSSSSQSRARLQRSHSHYVSRAGAG